MAGSGQDNSSSGGTTNPVVRLRGFPKKAGDPPPATPPATQAAPPRAPNAPPEVRFKRRPSSQPTVEAVAPPPETTPLVDEPAVADAAVPAESSAEMVEPLQAIPEEQGYQTYQEPLQEYPVEQADQTYQEPLDAWPVEQAEQIYQDPVEELPVEQYQANEVPVEPLQDGVAESPGGASFQEVIPKTPDPPVAASPGITGVRLRLPPKRAEAATDAPAASSAPAPSNSVGQLGPRPEGRSTAPAGLPYTPDTDIDRIYRRQWWKHDLKVKAGLWPGAEAQK